MAAAWSLDTAPRDGTMVRLLVDYSEGEHPLEDTHDEAWTIGFNNDVNDGQDTWKFAGWCWSQDHFTEGKGRVLGWLPYSRPLIAGWREIAEAPRDGTPCDLWMNGQRWTDFRWKGKSWQREEGYPAVTRRLLATPTHFMISPSEPA